MRWSSTKIILAATFAFCLAAGVGAYFAINSDWAWRLRFEVAVDSQNYESAVATIETMSRSRRSALNEMPMDSLSGLDTKLQESGEKNLRKRLLAVLAGDSYDPEEMFVPPDNYRLAYARVLNEAGDSKRARVVVLGLRNPAAIGEASLDPGLRAFFPAEVDVRAAAEAELAVNREAMATHPYRLEAVYKTSENLRQLGRAREALEILQAAQAEIGTPGAFSDLQDHLSWFWDNMARTYRMLGRYDDALAAYAKGGSARERGNLNVSQVLNMAGNQLSFGRNEDALRTIAVFDDPKRTRSPYGEMVLRYVRGCAHAFAGRRDLAGTDLAYAKAHEQDNREAYAWLMLCTGDMDGAAAAYIKRLDDPEQSGDALMSFSDFDDPPVAKTPDPFDPLLKAVAARPDVKAAIRRAGGVRRFRVQGFSV
jgi:tetratricopeptide (TPR) repeat protein